MDSLANVLHFFTDKLTGLRGGRLPSCLSRSARRMVSCSGIKNSCETVTERQFVFVDGQFYRVFALARKIVTKQINQRENKAT
jgi:hypothetical protein